MVTASLPELPRGKIFEEFIAAYFQCAGLYVERNLTDRQEREVLELDIITTSYSKNSLPDSKLVEVKSGRWGFSDIFKIRGWLDYLNFATGALIVNQAIDSLDFVQSIGNMLKVQVVSIPDLSQTDKFIAPIIGSTICDKSDISLWRFVYWAERNILELLKAKKKCAATKQCYGALDRYFFLINDKTFFTRNIVERAERVYETYKKFPNISAKMGHELEGEIFDTPYQTVPSKLFDKTYYDCDLTDLMLSTFVEHRARLAILKAAIDYCLLKKLGDEHNLDYSLLDSLPDSFKKGLEKISSHSHYFLYPVFWQWFLWFFGGFIMKDYEKEEMTLLSKKTGIPIQEIPNAFEAYEILFPLEGGWFTESEWNNIRLIKLLPVPFMGVGANIRRMIYGKDQDWEGISHKAKHTVNDLVKWNNTLVSLLMRNE